MLLGAIADDFTGATDLCSMLVRGGMRTVQLIGVPRDTDAPPDADAVVVALKSRTAPVRDAVQQSLAALAWLRRAGCRQFFFKYCSTFDSTEEGNIGPVADALIRELGCGFALACPAFPTNARTVYQGHLFVGGTLLNESGMEHHPLTPMTDANLVRVLGRQTDGTVGLVPYVTVEQGSGAIRDAMTALKEQGRRYAIVDAVNDAHLLAIGEAASEHALITGGSGVAMGLPENFRRAGLLPAESDAGALPHVAGHAAVLAGSCSRATLTQLGIARSHVPVWQLDPLATPDAAQLAAAALDWACGKLGAHADRHRRIGAAGQGCRVAGEAWTRCRRRVDRSGHGADRRGHRRERRATHRRRGRRNGGRGGAARSASAACASARRSIPACPGPMRRAAASRC